MYNIVNNIPKKNYNLYHNYILTFLVMHTHHFIACFLVSNFFAFLIMCQLMLPSTGHLWFQICKSTLQHLNNTLVRLFWNIYQGHASNSHAVDLCLTPKNQTADHNKNSVLPIYVRSVRSLLDDKKHCQTMDLLIKSISKKYICVPSKSSLDMNKRMFRRVNCLVQAGDEISAHGGHCSVLQI